MNKRFWIRISLCILGFILLSAPFWITFFFWQAYRSVGLGIMMLLVSALQWYTGAKLRQTAKKSGASLPPWWKYYPIVMALMWLCFGLLECFVGLTFTVKFVHNVFESVPGGIFFGLFIMLTIGIGIYSIILTVLYLTQNRRNKA